MNIESYTIIFLKKQRYLNLPGIGNFKLIKSNGEDIVEFSPVSIIDDLFASFIGVNENVSSNNAANAISKYAKEIKNSLKEGKDVNIPGLGTLHQSGSTITFKQESEDTFLRPIENKNFRDLTFGSGSMHTMQPNIISDMDEAELNKDMESAEPTTFQTETYNPAYDFENIQQESEKKERQKKMTKNLLTTVLVLSILGILVWAFYNFLYQDDTTEVTTPTTTQEVDESATTAATTAAADSTTQASAASSASEWAFVVKSYDSQISADKRAKQLSDYGWEATNEPAGESGNYNIVIKLPNDGRSTDAVADSLRKVLNPGGKVYLKN